MALLRQLLVFALVLCLSPGMPELLENLEHLVHDGHLAHASVHDEDEDQAHAALEAEHGCTPMSHNCGCHISVPIVLPETSTLEARVHQALLASRNPAVPSRLVTRANAPPVPPPTA